MAIALVWVLTLAFPKAGLYVGDVPVTIASVVVMIYGAYYFVFPGSPAKAVAESRLFTRYHLIFVWMISLSLLVNMGALSALDVTTWVLLAASPLAFHAGLRAKEPKRLIVIILMATVAVGAYGLVQNLFGVTETAIPGLTHLAGENLIEDNPIRTPSGTLKSPSTYHNGNLAASMLLLGLGVATFAKLVSRAPRMLIMLAVAGASVGIVVSLSRSAAFAFAVVALIAMLPPFRPRWLGRRLAAAASVLLLAMGSLVGGQVIFGTDNFIIDRFIGDSLNDTSAAGRTEGYTDWIDGLREMEPAEFVGTLVYGDGSVSSDEGRLEGFPWLMAKYGVGATIAFLLLLFMPLRLIRTRLGADGTILWFGLAASGAMWLVDNTYLFPPTVMNWFLVAGLSVQLSSNRSAFATGRTGVVTSYRELDSSTGDRVDLEVAAGGERVAS